VFAQNPNPLSDRINQAVSGRYARPFRPVLKDPVQIPFGIFLAKSRAVTIKSGGTLNFLKVVDSRNIFSAT
jgi:hypothetical protein